MICFTCNLKSICKVFEMANNMSSSIDIVVDRCLVRPNGEKGCITSAPSIPEAVKQPIRTQETLLNMSDKIKKAARELELVVAPPKPEPKKATAKAKAKAADAAIEKLTVQCIDCGAKVFETAAGLCGGCGKIICVDCSMRDAGTNKEYCGECWEKAPPSQL